MAKMKLQELLKTNLKPVEQRRFDTIFGGVIVVDFIDVHLARRSGQVLENTLKPLTEGSDAHGWWENFSFRRDSGNDSTPPPRL